VTDHTGDTALQPFQEVTPTSLPSTVFTSVGSAKVGPATTAIVSSALSSPTKSTFLTLKYTAWISPENMQAYLAEKYMSGPKADAILARADGVGKKKKKRKADTESSSALAGPSRIQDDDISGFSRVLGVDPDADEDMIGPEDGAPVVASDRGFKKRKTDGTSDGWATVQEGLSKSKEETPPPPDEAPQVVAAPFAGGLMTTAQIRATRAAKEGTSSSKKAKAEAPDPAQQETVYRDASGRQIDTKAEKAEAARKKREREEKEAQKMEWGKGVVQREDAERQKRELEAMSRRDFARTANDKQLNEDQKAAERWNDPAAAFLTVRVLLLRPADQCRAHELYRQRRQRVPADLNTLARHHPRTALGSSRGIGGMALVSFNTTLLTSISRSNHLRCLDRSWERLRGKALPARQRTTTQRPRELSMVERRYVKWLVQHSKFMHVTRTFVFIHSFFIL
jgi:pre-mRNA-splicing factor CWC26